MCDEPRRVSAPRLALLSELMTRALGNDRASLGRLAQLSAQKANAADLLVIADDKWIGSAIRQVFIGEDFYVEQTPRCASGRRLIEITAS